MLPHDEIFYERDAEENRKFGNKDSFVFLTESCVLRVLGTEF
jgi:hypothetical protein